MHHLPTTQSVAACALCCTLLLHAAANAQSNPPDQRNLQVMASSAVNANRNQRVALVIGNAAYKEAPLLNPVNDARAFAKALQDSGFTVILRENTDQRGMMSALREFGDKLRSGGVGIFYYAGHGMQIKGRNYLIPVGANVEREDEVAYSAVDAQAVLDKMEAAGNASNIMILDACRNNPFTRSTRSGQAGLAQMDAPVGTLVAFATSPGAVASDGAGSNGLYTQHLLDAMRKPGLKVEDVFKQVRANVRRDSLGKQVPWEATSLEGDFYFKPGAVGGEQSTAARPVATEAQIEVALWDAVKNSDVPIELRAYLNRYPQGRFADDARGRIAALLPPAATATATTLPTSSKPPMPSTAPSSNISAVRITYNTGDSWDLTVFDLLSGKNNASTATISNVNAQGDWEMNNGSIRGNAQGQAQFIRSTLLNGTRERTFSAGFRQIPTSLVEGHVDSFNYFYDDRFTDGRTQRFEGKGTIRVLGREKITTPAGSFLAWKFFRVVEGKRLDASNSVRVETTAWFVPEVKRIVAQELIETNLSTNRIVQNERSILQSIRLNRESDRQLVASNRQRAQLEGGGVDFVQSNAIQADLQPAVDQRTDELLKQLAATMPGTQSNAAPAPRPAVASNSFGFTVGDRWRYQVVDKFKGEVVRNYARQIQSLTSSEMIFTQGALHMDARGDFVLTKNSERERRLTSGSFRLPQILQAGYKQDIQFSITDTSLQGGSVETLAVKGSYKVVGRETVRTPAGEFNAWKVEREEYWQSQQNGNNRGRYINTGWYVPELRDYVAIEEDSRNANGAIIRRERHELTSHSVRGADEALAKR